MPLPLTTLATLSRDLLSQTFKDPRSLLAFERFQLYVAQVIPETFTAFQNLAFVVTAADPTIPNAHVITAGANISVTPATGLVTLKATPSGPSGQIQYNNAGTFGSFAVSGDATLNTTTGILTIANGAVSYAKMQNTSAASVLLGRGASSGAGVVQEITLGSGVSMAGTVLSATGSGGTVTSVSSANADLTVATGTTTPVLTINSAPKLDTARSIAITGDLAWSVNFDGSAGVTAAGTIQANAVTTSKINNAAVTYAKIQNVSANSVLLGSSATGSGAAPSEIVLGTNLSMSGSTLNASGGSGTVSSVGLSAPSIFTVTVSPITTSGTLTFTLNTQSANLVFAGPTTGAAVTPTFRALVAADLPNNGANPSATASDTAVNGSATTWMRSDAAPAIQKASSSQFGVVEVDGTSITASGGVISAVGATAWTKLATSSPSGTNTVTFSSLGSYRHLMIIGVGRSTQAGSGADNIALTFNSDTTSGHYATQLTYSDSSGVHSFNATSGQTSILPAQLGQASTLSNGATIFTILIPFYSQTTFSKFTQGQYTYVSGASLPAFGQLNTAGYWSSTAAITSITLAITGNYVAGSIIDVYVQD